jgi:hypothetical protein
MHQSVCSTLAVATHFMIHSSLMRTAVLLLVTVLSATAANPGPPTGLLTNGIVSPKAIGVVPSTTACD